MFGHDSMICHHMNHLCDKKPLSFISKFMTIICLTINLQNSLIFRLLDSRFYDFRNIEALEKIGLFLFHFWHHRSSRPEVFCKKSVLRNFTNTCARVSFLINLQASGLRPATLLKKKLWHSRFPVNFVKFPGTPFFYRTPPLTVSDIKFFITLFRNYQNIRLEFFLGKL